jgi:hypothetical protein
MLAIIIYIGLFVWGMNSERLGIRHALTILAIVAVQTTAAWLLFRGLDGSGWPPVEFFYGALLELALQTVLLLIGYGVGRYRRARSAPVEDVVDTFS